MDEQPDPEEHLVQESNKNQRPHKRIIVFSTASKPIKTSTPKKGKQHQEVERVCNLRKRKNQYKYLVKWNNRDEEEWVSRDIMIANHPQSVIAFFESIIRFK